MLESSIADVGGAGGATVTTAPVWTDDDSAAPGTSWPAVSSPPSPVGVAARGEGGEAVALGRATALPSVVPAPLLRAPWIAGDTGCNPDGGRVCVSMSPMARDHAAIHAPYVFVVYASVPAPPPFDLNAPTSALPAPAAHGQLSVHVSSSYNKQ